jgi:TolB-like protein
MRFCFDDCVLDIAKRELWRNGLLVPIAPQALDLLVYLIQHREQIVSKDQLVGAIWGGRVVADSALTTRVNVLRSLIGDSGQQQRLIKTFARKGFRFVGHVSEQPPPASQRQAVSTELPSIAVLPFLNLSGDSAQDFFGHVIAEEVLTELARLHWLLVIARNSSFLFKDTGVDVREIGRQLNVKYVLEGSTRHSEKRARVACRLVDTRTGIQAWSARYDRSFNDIFDVQVEIADAVVNALVPALINAERLRVARRAPNHLNAWESYQRGVWHMLGQSVDDNRLARQMFEQAIALEADYSPGYDGLAWTYLMDASAFGRTSIIDGCLQSERLARQAIRLDPDNAEARARLALTIHLTGDNHGSIAEAEEALAINPNCADAFGVRGAALVFSGERTEGRASLERYLRLSPRDPARPIRQSQIAASYYLEGDYQRAAQLAERTVRHHPTVHFANRWLLASLGQLGRSDEGTKVMARLSSASAASINLHIKQMPPYYRRNDFDHMVEGLAKAGWRR